MYFSFLLGHCCTGADGSRYEGGFAAGRKSGHGVQVSAAGGRYEGAFSGGKMHGRGTYTGADGSVFEGEYVDGVPQEAEEAAPEL